MAYSRKSALALAAVFAVAMLVLCSSPAEASQLNMYEGPNCTGRWVPCWDRQCCNVIYTGSYRFYYNDGWPAYLYKYKENCDGRWDAVLRSTVDCTNNFPFKSVKQTDTAP